jgi:hypothetical protein
VLLPFDSLPACKCRLSSFVVLLLGEARLAWVVVWFGGLRRRLSEMRWVDKMR